MKIFTLLFAPVSSVIRPVLGELILNYIIYLVPVIGIGDFTVPTRNYKNEYSGNEFLDSNLRKFLE